MFVTSNVYIMFLHISCCLAIFRKPFNVKIVEPWQNLTLPKNPIIITTLTVNINNIRPYINLKY